MTQSSRKKTTGTNNGFRAKKSLGQNFLVDQQVIQAIVEGAGIGENDLVLEIGPGMGAITRYAAKKCRKLLAIEIDQNVIPRLEKTLAEGDIHNVKILEADFLQVDMEAEIAALREEDPELENVRVIGNLPYYITTPILMKILESGLPVQSITVMMQQEVADRIEAAPSTKPYGGLSVAVQYYCQVQEIIKAPSHCFRPAPKVQSTVLRLDLRQEKEARPADEKIFFTCIKTAFSKRRKTLLNCFTGAFGMDKETAAKELLAAGIDPSRRGETLTIQEFAALADHFAKRKEE